MKGCNTLTLNQATINDALQDWVDKHIDTKPTVVSVKQTNDGYAKEFEVEVNSEVDRPGTKAPTP